MQKISVRLTPHPTPSKAFKAVCHPLRRYAHATGTGVSVQPLALGFSPDFQFSKISNYKIIPQEVYFKLTADS
ncbi:MAG: hypothetical protein F6J98_42260 [Moorea sp. SIO4G2]|nr:hypothetical protein [Moorena sp. SIO4G2]